MTKTKKTTKGKKIGVVSYPAGDFLIRLKNAALAGKHDLSLPGTRQVVSIAKALEKEGYVSDVEKTDKEVTIHLSYKHKKPVLFGLKLVSRPGLRIYMDARRLSQKRGASVFLVSTSKGLITSKEAAKKNLGGEVIAEIW